MVKKRASKSAQNARGKTRRGSPGRLQEKSTSTRRVVRSSRPVKPGIGSEEQLYEVEILDGLEDIAKRELQYQFAKEVRILPTKGRGHLTFFYSGSPARLLRLRTVVAVYRVLYFKLPHPLSIVQGEALSRLLTTIAQIREKQRFSSFRIGAAGHTSAEFRKIKEILTRETKLTLDEEEGDMPIRFRRSRIESFGWDVLIRLTPRPLSARSWRKENMPGALNATIAAGMVMYTEPRKTDRFLNVMCGSGTFLIERAFLGEADVLVGTDSSPDALALAKTNLQGTSQKVKLLCEEIRALSLPDKSITTVCADLPWGRLIGKRSELARIYRDTILQVARVCMTGARFAVLTQEDSLFENELKKLAEYWHRAYTAPIKQGDYRPTLFILVRSETAFRKD